MRKVAESDDGELPKEDAQDLMRRVIAAREKGEEDIAPAAQEGMPEGRIELPETLEATDPAYQLRPPDALAAREKIEQIEANQEHLFQAIQASQSVRCSARGGHGPALSTHGAVRAQAMMLKIGSLTDTMEAIAQHLGAKHPSAAARRQWR